MASRVGRSEVCTPMFVMYLFAIVSLTQELSSHFVVFSFFGRDIELDDEEPPKGSFLMRFSVSRLRKVVADTLNAKKRAVISKCSFASLMDISQFSVQPDLIHFVVMNIDPKKRMFRYVE